MDEGKVDPTALPPPTIKTRDSQGSPVAILAIAFASGIGYVSWKWWKRWQGEKKCRESSPTGQESTAKSRGTCFAFDKQPISALSTSGRPSSSNSTRRPSRQDPKPKTQKQLRKQAKKAAREQAVQNAENGAVAAAIAKRSKELGLGNQPPEQPKQYYVDYEGVSQAYDKIVSWQQTGKKQY